MNTCEITPAAAPDIWLTIFESQPDSPVKVAIRFRRSGDRAEFFFDTPYMKKSVALPVDELRERIKLILPFLEP